MSDPKSLIASKFLDSFLTQIILDTALSTHSSIKRARSICKLCGVRCQAHTPAAQQSSSPSTLLLPSSSSNDNAATTGSRSGTPAPGGTKPDYYSNNPLFECLVCSRQVSSNRYATHLAKCMGMGSKGGRKGAARNAKATTNAGGTGGLASGRGTPRYGSDVDEDLAKKKGKNGAKRASSPLAASSLANVRMNKRMKTSSPTPPPEAASGLNRSFSSQTFAPSALGTSTVLSGSPLNPHNNANTKGGKANGSSTLAQNGADKRKRDDQEHVGGSYVSGASDDGEEGEISDDDEDVALASRPSVSGGGTKIKIPLRGASAGAKQKTFTIIDDSDDDSDTNLSFQRRGGKVQVSDGDDQDDDEDDEDEQDDDDVQVTRVSHGSSGGVKKKTSRGAGNGLQRERGSDGEFIDVESASEQSDADSF